MNTGLDPEVLTLSGGLIIPASHFLDPPTKSITGRLNALSYDNAAIEMRPAQSNSLDTLTRRAGSLLRKATVRMRLARAQQRIPPDSALSLIPSAMLAHASLSLESVKSFGCSPSLLLTDSYGVRSTMPIVGPDETAFRSAGFHIHQELSYPNTEQLIVAVLDGLLGLMDVMVNYKAEWRDASRTRRLTLGYGKAGEYRVRQTLGNRILEYRVLSPWPLSAPKTLLWVMSVVKDVCNLPADALFDILNDYPNRTQITRTINSADSKLAEPLWNYCMTTWRGAKYANRTTNLGQSRGLSSITHIDPIIRLRDSWRLSR